MLLISWNNVVDFFTFLNSECLYFCNCVNPIFTNYTEFMRFLNSLLLVQTATSYQKLNKNYLTLEDMVVNLNKFLISGISCCPLICLSFHSSHREYTPVFLLSPTRSVCSHTHCSLYQCFNFYIL